MPSQEDIRHQQTLLEIHRRNLAQYIKQQGLIGEAFAPPMIVNGIRESRENIQRIKGILRGWNVSIDDLPDEGAPDAAATAQQSSAQPYPPTPSTVPQLQATAAASFKYDVFISYSSADEQWVEHTLLKTLEDAGLRVCIDFRDFAVGRPTIINIQDAALQSRHTLLVITQDWIKSEWTLFESLLIRTKDPGSLQRRTIPLRLQQVELPDFISMLTWVDFTRADRHEIAWRKLFMALTETTSDGEKSSIIEPTATPSSPLPLPPQSTAGIRATPEAETSTGSTQASPSLRDVKKQALNKRLANLMAEYEAINKQIDGALGEVDRIRLKRQADNLEQEISQIESDLRAL